MQPGDQVTISGKVHSIDIDGLVTVEIEGIYLLGIARLVFNKEGAAKLGICTSGEITTAMVSTQVAVLHSPDSPLLRTFSTLDYTK